MTQGLPPSAKNLELGLQAANRLESCLNPFQAAQLVSASSKQPVWSESLCIWTLLHGGGGERIEGWGWGGKTELGEDRL